MALPHEPLKGYLANVEAELSEAVRERESLRTQVERLRGVEKDAVEWVEERTKRLRADNERLRAALREIADHADLYGPPDQGDALALMHVARRALEGK